MAFPPAGTAPALDAPGVGEQGLVTASASFPPSPTAADICGFKIPPKFSFNLGVNLPFPNFKLPLPFNFSLALKCSLSDPIAAEASFGGGRVATGQQEAEAEDIDY